MVLGSDTSAAVLVLRKCDDVYSDVMSAVYVVPLYIQSSIDSEELHCVPGDKVAAKIKSLQTLSLQTRAYTLRKILKINTQIISDCIFMYDSCKDCLSLVVFTYGTQSRWVSTFSDASNTKPEGKGQAGQ